MDVAPRALPVIVTPMARAHKSSRLTVLISSSVYGREPLIEQIFAWLEMFGYEAWSSHVGSLPVELAIEDDTQTYASCIRAAEQCDIFFGLITPRYGSGTDGAGGPAISELELAKAIELDKPRLILAHDQVVLARRLLMDLGFVGAAGRKALTLRKGAGVIDDLRLIDMYEAASQEDLPIPDRNNNWVQKYSNEADVRLYVERQFGRYAAMEAAVQRWRQRREPQS